MRRRIATLPVLLVAVMLALALGATPAMAEKSQKTVDISFSAKPALSHSIFIVNFSGYGRFFRLANRFLQAVPPVTGFSVLQPAPTDTDQPLFFFSPCKAPSDEPEISKIVDNPEPL